MKLRLAKRLGAAVKLGNALKLVQSKQRFALAMASASAATFAGLMLLAGAHGEPPASDPASAVAVAADQVDRADQVERGAYL